MPIEQNDASRDAKHKPEKAASAPRDKEHRGGAEYLTHTDGPSHFLSESKPDSDYSWRRHTYSITAKLLVVLLGSMMITFSVLGFANLRLHRKHLEAETLRNAQSTSEIIKRSTSYHMLHNDQEALANVIATVGGQPGIVRLRIVDRQARIKYSSVPAEVNHTIDRHAADCNGCHERPEFKAEKRPDSHRELFRIFQDGSDRMLGVISPIENQPSCSNAACHAHSPDQKVLGVLDTELSLARADANLAESSWQMVIYTLLAMLGVALIISAFIFRLVHKPVKTLKAGTEHLAGGELGYTIKVRSNDELGELAQSFNQMSLQLRAADEEIKAWTRTLEQRVESKSNELKRAHDKMLQVEKMASIGKLAAVVAHEVNNPLSGILTYAKLMRKWLDRDELDDARRKELGQCLDLIAAESRRCGELVKNLLTFSRTAPMNLIWADLNQVMERCAKLVQHKLELATIALQMDLDQELPPVHCDPAQIEQVILALVMNAIDAMPRGGNLWLRTRNLSQSGQIELQVRDDGTGIPSDLLAKLFEPFVTTKESGKGVGLGLAISRTIVERHSGQIEVDSELGRGTCFHIFLPLDANESASAAAAGSAAASK